MPDELFYEVTLIIKDSQGNERKLSKEIPTLQLVERVTPFMAGESSCKDMSGTYTKLMQTAVSGLVPQLLGQSSTPKPPEPLQSLPEAFLGDQCKLCGERRNTGEAHICPDCDNCGHSGTDHRSLPSGDEEECSCCGCDQYVRGWTP